MADDAHKLDIGRLALPTHFISIRSVSFGNLIVIVLYNLQCGSYYQLVRTVHPVTLVTS